MADRVPIVSIAGLLDGWAATDFLVMPAGGVGTLTEVFFAVTDAPSGGSVALALRNATGGGGAGISATIADGQKTATATGSVVLTGAEAVYLRVVSASGSAMNLSGWFAFDQVVAGIPTLTNLTRVKRERKITGSAKDAILTDLIAEASERMQEVMERRIVQTVVTAEKHDGKSRDTLLLDQFPIITPPAVVVRLNGTVVDATTYELDQPGGKLIKVKDGVAGVWEKGRRNFEVDYTHGHATIPESIVGAATRQVSHLFLKTSESDNRLSMRGEILDAGGSAQFLTGYWAVGVLELCLDRRERRLR